VTRRGWTYEASPNLFPEATSWDQASPTILVPAGIVTVSVRMYDPASTKMIFEPALSSSAF
jgi:hypothetical protein